MIERRALTAIAFGTEFSPLDDVGLNQAEINLVRFRIMLLARNQSAVVFPRCGLITNQFAQRAESGALSGIALFLFTTRINQPLLGHQCLSLLVR